MRVRYFIDIINELLKQGVSQTAIADALGVKKQNMTEILGKNPKKLRQNLKDEHLPGLLRLCREYKVGPKTASELIALIDKEVKK